MKDCTSCVVRNRAICAGLGLAELEILSRLGRKQHVSRGQVLIWEGDDAIVVANVISGILKVALGTADGREQIVGVVFPSDFIGRPFGEKNPYTITALCDAELCIFPRSDFDRFARQYPDLEHNLLERTLTELDRAREWMLLLGRKAANEKLATLLLSMSERLGEGSCSGTATLDRFDLPLDRQQMGDLLGLTIETVSRQMTRLKREGIISLPDRRSIIIHERDRLEQIALAA
jgi:CRP/FNR family transcriptional regulator, anaerobic regulatory protein